MSSARIPPSSSSHSEASQPKPVALIGAQLGAKRLRRLVLGDRVEIEQRADLPLPRLRLLGRTTPSAASSAHRPGLVAADPQRRRGRLAERPGLLDQLAQRLQARRQQREVRAVIEQHPRLAARERREHLRERQLAALDVDRHAEVEPVALPGDLAGGHADRQRVADVAIVGRLPLDLDRDAGSAARARGSASVLSSMLSVPPSETAGPRAGRPAPSSSPKRSEPVPSRTVSPRIATLGFEVTEPGRRAVAVERRAPVVGADLVGPLPPDARRHARRRSVRAARAPARRSPAR